MSLTTVPLNKDVPEHYNRSTNYFPMVEMVLENSKLINHMPEGYYEFYDTLILFECELRTFLRYLDSIESQDENQENTDYGQYRKYIFNLLWHVNDLALQIYKNNETIGNFFNNLKNMIEANLEAFHTYERIILNM